MSKIYGSLYVTNSDWKYVYNTIINFFNQELTNAYFHASEFYNKNKSLSPSDYSRELEDYCQSLEISKYQKTMISFSTYRPGKVMKPKKNVFVKFTNRTTYIDVPDVNLDFDKNQKSIKIVTSDFDDFDKYLANNSFITEFINMINSINWPTRTGPNKTIKGCTLVRTKPFGEEIIFYSTGPNPPIYEAQTEVVDPPAFVNSAPMKNLKLTSTSPEETSQPIPQQQDLSEL